MTVDDSPQRLNLSWLDWGLLNIYFRRVWHWKIYCLKDQQLLIVLTDWSQNRLEITVDNITIGSEADKFQINFGSVSPSDFDSITDNEGHPCPNLLWCLSIYFFSDSYKILLFMILLEKEVFIVLLFFIVILFH